MVNVINPYTLYCLGFAGALLTYSLGWSEIYPKLTSSLLIFLIVTLIIHFAMSRWWTRRKNLHFYPVSARLNPVYVTIFIYCLWIADFIYSGGIPLFKILLYRPFDFRNFGVPSLHVFTVTFSSFYILFLFHVYLTSRSKLILLLYLINSAAAILIYSRSMMAFNLAGSFFIYLFSLKEIPYKKAVLLMPLIILVFYIFGIVGNRRSAFEASKPYSETIFLETGRATENFRQSWVPTEFFWAYIYISSPLANLQLNILTYPVPPVSMGKTLEFINNEFLFESISKRINEVAGIEREKENTIRPQFNVSTVYSRSYSYLGWTGMIAMGLFVMAVPLVYSKLLPKENAYTLTAFAILCTTYLFLVYDNTIRLMALGFQLVYPFVFPLAERFLKRSE